MFSIMVRTSSAVGRFILLGLVGLYRYGISPVLPPRCRYQPTCSAYAMEAIRQHGPVRGGLLAFRRVLRCHPWGGHGFDPVPPAGVTQDHRYEAGFRAANDAVGPKGN